MSDKFPLGQVNATPGILSAVPQIEILECVRRHHSGDWGDVDEHDRTANDAALADGSRLFSVYHSTKRVKFWIITEADRSLTTVLLPSEY